jgi:tetraacyldisaccharide 4'-kinase
MLTRAWQRRGPLACALWPLSLLFHALVALRAGLYRSGLLKAEGLAVPVVVVGNIFIGGTGKTPLTLWLVQALRAAGRHPGVISRGHGGKGSAPRAVTAASTAQDAGDEPLLIAQRGACPVFVGRDRVAAGRALLAAHPEVDIVLSDDGLQHYRLRRDVEIVLFDGRGLGNGWLLPAGPLREAPGRRRDVTVVNTPLLTPALAALAGQDGAPVMQMRLTGEYAERLADRSQRLLLSALAGPDFPGRRLAAAAGIGHPERFFGMLRDAGLDFTALALPDHHDFLDRPFDVLEADLILITEKDAVKCAQIEHLIDDPRLWVVPVAARIDGPLADHILEKCHGRTTA